MMTVRVFLLKDPSRFQKQRESVPGFPPDAASPQAPARYDVYKTPAGWKNACRGGGVVEDRKREISLIDTLARHLC